MAQWRVATPSRTLSCGERGKIQQAYDILYTVPRHYLLFILFVDCKRDADAQMHVGKILSRLSGI